MEAVSPELTGGLGPPLQTLGRSRPWVGPGQRGACIPGAPAWPYTLGTLPPGPGTRQDTGSQLGLILPTPSPVCCLLLQRAGGRGRWPWTVQPP